MAADSDFTLDAMLEIDDSQVEDVNNQLEADVTADQGGGVTPGAADQQESIVAGGVSKGLLASGIIAGILSQLKIVTGTISAVLGALSRALIPSIEGLAELFRPLVDTVNDLAATPGESLQSTADFLFGPRENPNQDFLRFLGVDEENIRGGASTGENEGVVDLFGEAFSFLGIGGPATADQTGETSKQQLKQNLEDKQREKTGSFR